MGSPELPSGPVLVSANCERRKWTLVLALALVLLVFHAAQSDLHSKTSPASDPWSLDFKGNETVGTVHLSPCEDGVDCGYIVCVSCRARRWSGLYMYSVPKDHFDASAGVAQIAVARRRATVGSSQGHVMLNPGTSIAARVSNLNSQSAQAAPVATVIGSRLGTWVNACRRCSARSGTFLGLLRAASGAPGTCMCIFL
jgi:hypothetical protein